jgi:hypothetical protein
MIAEKWEEHKNESIRNFIVTTIGIQIDITP